MTPGGLSWLRAAYGAVLLLGPEELLSRLSLTPVDLGARAVARVLGVRELLQAELTRRHPTPGWLRVGAAVDAVHALTMIALAVADPDRRALASENAVTAGALAVAGMTVAQRAPAAQRVPAAQRAPAAGGLS